MRLKPTMLIEAEIHINDCEAEVLHQLCSIDSAEYFATKCNIPVDRIKTILYDLRQDMKRLLIAKEKALEIIRLESR